MLSMMIITGCKPKTIGFVSGQDFSIKESTSIEGGTYEVASLTIPAGVDLYLRGDTHLTITDDMLVEGAIISECSHLEFDIGGKTVLSGLIDNQCHIDDQKPADILIHSENGDLQLGSLNETVTIQSSGNIDIIVGPKRPNWQYELHPDSYSGTALAPVCTAQVEDVQVFMKDGSAPIYFLAKGIDPDGGEVDFRWDFGDGHSSTGAQTTHTYKQAGNYVVQLMGSDDDGQSCEQVITVSIIDPGQTDELENAVGLSIELGELVIEQNSQILLQAQAAHFLPEDMVNYQWQADFFSSNEILPVVSFTEPGRHEIVLTLTDQAGMDPFAQASVSVYVLPEPLGSIPSAKMALLAQPAVKHDCAAPGADVIAIAPVLVGNWVRIEFWPLFDRHLMLLPGTSITTQDGKNHNTPAVGKGNVWGKNGGNGYNMYIRNFVGDLVLCGGASFTAGNGGQGQSAISENNLPSQDAYARGGRGGSPGALYYKVGPYDSIYVQGTNLSNNIFLSPANGGNGGNALAEAGDGGNSCQSPGRGGGARAVGGVGGSANYTLTCPKNLIFENLGGIVIQNNGAKMGNAGSGGDAAAIAGKGGSVLDPNGNPCANPACINGASGGRAVVQPGKGGQAILNDKSNCAVLGLIGFNGGNGGRAAAQGGIGGNGGQCQTGGKGGRGGDAQVIPSTGGKGFPGANGLTSAAFAGAAINIEGRTFSNPGAGSGGDGGQGGDSARQAGKGGAGGTGYGPDVKNGNAGANGKIVVMEAEIEATSPPAIASGTGPEIIAINFPIGNEVDLTGMGNVEIPADGSEVIGTITFNDKDGDASYVFFKPLDEDSTFSEGGFYLSDLKEGELQGNLYTGQFQFWLLCEQPDYTTLGIAMQDAAGNWGSWKVLTVQCR